MVLVTKTRSPRIYIDRERVVLTPEQTDSYSMSNPKTDRERSHIDE